jgi:hypothetical protein
VFVQHPDDPPIAQGQSGSEGSLVVGGVDCARGGSGGLVAAQGTLPSRISDHGEETSQEEGNKQGSGAVREQGPLGGRGESAAAAGIGDAGPSRVYVGLVGGSRA